MKNRRKKISKESSFIIYPKEYGAYIAFTVIIVIFFIVLCYLLMSEPSNTDIDSGLKFLKAVLVCMWIIICGFLVNSSLLLFRKRIFLEVTETYIKFNGVFRQKIINISDIQSIRKVSGYKKITSIQIRRIKDSGTGSKIIYFPYSWFSERDLLNMIDKLKRNNKRMNVVGIYARVERTNNRPYVKPKN